MDAVSDFFQNEKFVKGAKVMRIAYYFLVIPTLGSWILDEWFGTFKRKLGPVIRGNKLQVLSATVPAGAYHVYYFEKYRFETFDGKIHLLATLSIALFWVMMFFDFRRELDIDVKRGVVISYLGVGVSFLSLAAERLTTEDELLSILFHGGLVFYFVGLFLISFRVNFNRS